MGAWRKSERFEMGRLLSTSSFLPTLGLRLIKDIDYENSNANRKKCLKDCFERKLEIANTIIDQSRNYG